MEILPPLRRDIDIVPLRHEGRSFLVVRDSLGIAENGLALNAAVGPYLAFFDGASSLRELQCAISRQEGGALVPGNQVLALVDELDRLGLLETERYLTARRKVVAGFSGLTVRPPVLAGSAYPDDPRALAEELDRHLALAEELDSPPTETSALRALAAPHIDLRAAGPAYGAAYRALRGLRPEAVLLLGTGHSLAEPYCLTAKSFRTPLGTVKADGKAVRQLRQAGGKAVAPDDFAHRSEHSLEFQLLFLQRLFDMERIPVIPLLCGTLEHLLPGGAGPLTDSGIAGFTAALARWLEVPGRLAVAGVDLAHVGPKFGDAEEARVLEERFRASDRELLAALEEGDAGGLFETVARNGNRYKVCGFSALWTLLAVLPGLRGTVLDYRVWHEGPSCSAVSFAAVSFTSRD